ncbi:MAG: DNA-processing protein DprA [Bacteroidales bacterium]|nr:DNA-processing protein DprA [Bacteroidales bacterium]
MIDLDEERICMCALNKIFGFKPRIAQTLVRELGSAKAVFELDDKTWTELLGPCSEFLGQVNRHELDWAEKELEMVAREGAVFICFTDQSYPRLLLDCEDAPVGLYYKGCSPPEETFGGMDPVAIVGTRDLSDYGREWCRKMVRAMAAGGKRPTIVSGLALGTDICAHLEALDCGLPTIGVMATGIESIYPCRHQRTAERIVSTPGCALVTDYPGGTAPLPIHFLRRNRIIAGMSKATILVESKIKGGGMMTANLSFSYSRDTFALPGRIDDLRSQGCNALIRQKIAEPITDCDSLMESLGLPGGVSFRDSADQLVARVNASRLPKDQIGKAAQILLEIRRHRGINMDELARACGIPYREVTSICSRLQDDSLISIDLLQRCTIDVK